MIFSVLIILVCVLLILVILVQNSKGGGIQSQFGAATQIMGVKRGTEFIEKATWYLALALIVLSLGSNFFIDRAESGTSTESAIEGRVESAPAPMEEPAAE
jgi:preprotein translocase subunit SecG